MLGSGLGAILLILAGSLGYRVLEVPDDPHYDFIPLVDSIDVLPAMSSLSIPMIIRVKNTAVQIAAARRRTRSRVSAMDVDVLPPIEGPTDCGDTITGCRAFPEAKVKWSYTCGPDRRWHAAETKIVLTCPEYKCWDKLKKLKKIERVAYGTSGDVSGDKSRVVGYAGMLIGG